MPNFTNTTIEARVQANKEDGFIPEDATYQESLSVDEDSFLTVLSFDTGQRLIFVETIDV